MTKTDFNPFLFYSTRLQTLLAKASKQKNPALWLYKNDARTILFMLEALTRIHDKAFDEKLFGKWNKRFKKLEDVLGQIDDYSILESEFKNTKKVSKEIIKYFTVNTNNYIEKLNQRLLAKDWFKNKMQSFDAKLGEFEVKYNKEYSDELKFAIIGEIDAIIYFSLKADYTFTKVEDEVHEIRRKLRWLSMYAQAFQGLIQLKKSGNRKKYALHYFTKEVLNSRFNKVEAKPKNAVVIEFDKDSFFALGFVINELGKLKDSVLKMKQLSDAVFVTENVTRLKAEEKAIAIMGLKNTVEQDVLKEASEMMRTFIVKDKMLDHLILK